MIKISKKKAKRGHKVTNTMGMTNVLPNVTEQERSTDMQEAREQMHDDALQLSHDAEVEAVQSMEEPVRVIQIEHVFEVPAPEPRKSWWNSFFK